MKALFLADGGAVIGLGHLRRSLVLAEVLRDNGFDCRFFVPEESAVAFAEAKGFSAENWPSDLAHLPDADLLVADSYRAFMSALRGWRARGSKLMVIDDLADRALSADVILNQNFFAETLHYETFDTKLLLGPKYALIDPRFFDARDKRVLIEQKRVLISFGGSDNGKLAAEAAGHLVAALPDAGLNLAVSTLHDIAAEARTFAEQHPKLCRLHHGADMAALMSEMDLYLGSAGTQTLEATAAGLPMIVAQISDNQAPNVAVLAAKGVPAFAVPDFPAMAEAALRTVRKGLPNPLASEVDGQGAKRAAEEIRSIL